jgi:hypothetical protein
VSKVQTSELTEGTVVLAMPSVGTDFGIPLTTPARTAASIAKAVKRTVRSHCRARGGTVVWFTDGTKTPPIHGRTAWWVAE